MIPVDLKRFNKLIKEANNRDHAVEVWHDGEKRSAPKGEAKPLEDVAPGSVYVLKICEPVAEGGTIQREFVFAEKPDAAPVAAAPGPAPATDALALAQAIGSKDSSTLLLLELRKQDQQAIEREREHHRQQLDGLRAQHQSELAAANARFDSEIERIKADFEFRLKLVEQNNGRLESDREMQYKLIEKRLRAEARYSKSAAETAWFDKLTENPMVAMFLAKMAGIDLGQLPALLSMLGAKDITSAAAGVAGASGTDAAKAFQDALASMGAGQ